MGYDNVNKLVLQRPKKAPHLSAASATYCKNFSSSRGASRSTCLEGSATAEATPTCPPVEEEDEAASVFVPLEAEDLEGVVAVVLAEAFRGYGML